MDNINSIKKLKIGWVVPKIMPYSYAMASTRLRAYDIINYLKEINIKSGLYNPFAKYDIAIFQKSFTSKFLLLAKFLKRKGVKIIFDINVNYINPDAICVNPAQQREIKEMLCLADKVIVPTFYLKDLYSQYNNNICIIEEIIDSRFFNVEKIHNSKTKVRLLFCGYAIKAKELHLIEDVLKHIYMSGKAELILICEKDPQLDIIPYKFYKYRHKNIPNLLLNGDIKISPRDLSREYNLGHTFTRIGYPMAVGLPVVASPVPSYQGSPAILCNSLGDWSEALEKLISDCNLRQKLAEEGSNFVKDNFSKEKIIPKYEQIFKEIFSHNESMSLL